jgi:hypothetical protein
LRQGFARCSLDGFPNLNDPQPGMEALMFGELKTNIKRHQSSNLNIFLWVHPHFKALRTTLEAILSIHD